MEKLLVKSVNGEEAKEELTFLRENYTSDVDCDILPAQLAIFRELLKSKKVQCLTDIVKDIKEMTKSGKIMIKGDLTVVV